MRGAPLLIAPLFFSLGCADLIGPEPPIVLSSPEAEVTLTLDPFSIQIADPEGKVVLASAAGDGAYQGVSATFDDATFAAKLLPGWDGYTPAEGPWRSAPKATLKERTSEGVTLALTDDDVYLTLSVTVSGPRVKLAIDAREKEDPAAESALNKTSLAFALPQEAGFFGLGERFATLNHRGFSLYSYAEEGGLGAGEGVPLDPVTPFPNGPSMTYFPVPFFLSNEGYAMHLDTTYRSEVHLGSERADAFRVAVNARAFATTVYVRADPLLAIADYTEDTGRPIVPAPWVFGPRRRVNRGAMVDGAPEYQVMRDRKIPVTGIDDALHFLPALSQLGKEAEIAQWTHDLHAAGYKVMAYNNPYLASNNANAAADYAYGKEHGYLMKGPDGEPVITSFISGKLLTVAAFDLTNPDAVAWFQSLLKRTLDLGYDGWMHDFGEYTPRDAQLFDGRKGDEVHNAFPVLSAKAAHDLLEKERPGDYLFFVRSGYSGTQGFVPAVWGGDAEVSFDNTQGLPSSVRGGLNLSMSGVPYWGSDMTGFKCITSDPHDKEVFLRWVEFGAVSPIMMEQDACSNPINPKTKWKLWNDQETQDIYRTYALLHTRLLPYFQVLAAEANATGKPITLHPFLLHPKEPEAWSVDDAYYLGAALYVAPVVARGQTQKHVWLPPGHTYVDVESSSVYAGGASVDVAAPLGKLPLFLVSGAILPLLDPSIDTLAPAADPTVVTLDQVADRLDVQVALEPGQTAHLVLVDGTVLDASRGGDQGNPDALTLVTEAEIAACSACYVTSQEGMVSRLRASTEEALAATLVIEDLTLTVKNGPARRIRWDVLRVAP